MFSNSLPWFVTVPWLVFALTWAVGALFVRKTARAEPGRSRIVHGVLLAAAYCLLFANWTRIGPLAWRLEEGRAVLTIVGTALTILGIGLAIWARVHLGRFWSGTITLKEEHRLIRSGPYGIVRNPIYTGILLATIGTALATHEVRGVVAVGLAAIAFRRKIRLEEEWLGAHFGQAYEDYRHDVPALIPLLGRGWGRHREAPEQRS